jgi:hypothetical protein
MGLAAALDALVGLALNDWLALGEGYQIIGETSPIAAVAGGRNHSPTRSPARKASKINTIIPRLR